MRVFAWACALAVAYVAAGVAITLTFDVFDWWTALSLAVIVGIVFGSAAGTSTRSSNA